MKNEIVPQFDVSEAVKTYPEVQAFYADEFGRMFAETINGLVYVGSQAEYKKRSIPLSQLLK